MIVKTSYLITNSNGEILTYKSNRREQVSLPVGSLSLRYADPVRRAHRNFFGDACGDKDLCDAVKLDGLLFFAKDDETWKVSGVYAANISLLPIGELHVWMPPDALTYDEVFKEAVTRLMHERLVICLNRVGESIFVQVRPLTEKDEDDFHFRVNVLRKTLGQEKREQIRLKRKNKKIGS